MPLWLTPPFHVSKCMFYTKVIPIIHSAPVFSKFRCKASSPLLARCSFMRTLSALPVSPYILSAIQKASGVPLHSLVWYTSHTFGLPFRAGISHSVLLYSLSWSRLKRTLFDVAAKDAAH